MTGIVGGLLAALLWGSSTVTDARATRIVGAIGVLGWGSIAGCTITLPVALIFALEGAVAATISFATGERLPALTLLGLVIALGGMTFVLTSVRVPVPQGQGHPLLAGLLATAAASLFGLSLFASARAIEQVPELWLPTGSHTFDAVRISRRQLAGIAALLTGVALVAATR